MGWGLKRHNFEKHDLKHHKFKNLDFENHDSQGMNLKISISKITMSNPIQQHMVGESLKRTLHTDLNEFTCANQRDITNKITKAESLESIFNFRMICFFAARTKRFGALMGRVCADSLVQPFVEEVIQKPWLSLGKTQTHVHPLGRQESGDLSGGAGGKRTH